MSMTNSSVGISTEEMPGHNHTISSSGSHTHYIAWLGLGANYGTLNSGNYLATRCEERGDWSQNYDLSGQGNSANSGKTSSTGAHTHTVNNTGANAFHENRPPYIVIYRFRRIN